MADIDIIIIIIIIIIYIHLYFVKTDSARQAKQTTKETKAPIYINSLGKSIYKRSDIARYGAPNNCTRTALVS